MSDSTQMPLETPLGLAPFESLQAEHEPWLEACFVPPRYFELMAGVRSVLVFGAEGSGKTALYRALVKRCYGPHGRPVRLLVTWRPALPGQDVPAGALSVREQVRAIFDASAMALLNHCAHYPDDFAAAPRWVKSIFVWFIHSYIQGDLRARLSPLLEASENPQVLREILETAPPEVFSPHSAPEQVAARLTEALARIGLQGVWVVSDGLMAWDETELAHLSSLIKAFLSTLPLFEQAQFTYKLLLPSRLESMLLHATALVRQRVDGYHLEWDVPGLQQIVERRLALAFGRHPFTLGDLYEAPAELLRWLERAGGASPRAWLAQVRPLVAHYTNHALDHPVDVPTWRKLRRHHPPRLYLDEKSRQVIVGGRPLSPEELPSRGYEVLAYLYRHGGRVVSKGELYFCAYRGLERVPTSPAEKAYESPKDYEGLIDTLLWRLRQAIEPEPSDPVLLVTVRGQGIRLESCW